MRKNYLANTFSPMMLGEGTKAVVYRDTDTPSWLFKRDIQDENLISIVSHDITAKILSTLFQKEIPFNRTNVQLQPGDKLICVIPNFRATEAREFSREEVEAAGFRSFKIHVESDKYELEGY